MTGLPLFTASGTFPEAQDARARAVDPGWSAQLVAASIQELSANIHAQYQPKSTGKGVLEQKAAIGGSLDQKTSVVIGDFVDLQHGSDLSWVEKTPSLLQVSASEAQSNTRHGVVLPPTQAGGGLVRFATSETVPPSRWQRRSSSRASRSSNPPADGHSR